MAYDDKATVSIDSEGAVLKCAKGADVSACGFTPGAKVCGKCGAMPVEMKMVPATDLDIADEDMTEEDMQKMYGMMPKKKPMKGMGMDMDVDMEDDMESEEDDMEEEDEDMMDDEEKVNTAMKKFKKKGVGAVAGKPQLPEDESEAEYPEDDEDFAREIADEMDSEDEEDMAEAEKQNIMMDKYRKRRMATMGMKSDEIGEYDYICAIERKSYSAVTSVCDNCPGGCVAEKGMPGLLSVEGMAEEMFDGKVIDSGYSPDADMFVVDVQAKDGKAVEVFIDGTSAEVMGWHKLDESVFEQKAAIDELNLISFTDAAEIAVKSIDGHVVAVEPDNFEGIDSYAVEIEGFDGKSYDVFIALDGEVLGYDKYEPEEAEEIEAEAAEIALKRAFTEEQRNSMAKEGNALPDGSYPIANESDLRNAIQAFGRAKDKEAAKRHILKRARELGKENLIPAGWVAGGEGMSKKDDETLDGDFMKSLVEFQLLEAETDTI
jgi:uncharacterized membrane protein YkoI